MEFVARGTLVPHVDAIYPFERADEALAHLNAKRVIGKIVLSRESG